MICNKCSTILQRAFETRDEMREAEEHYFIPKRAEAHSRLSPMEKVQADMAEQKFIKVINYPSDLIESSRQKQSQECRTVIRKSSECTVCRFTYPSSYHLKNVRILICDKCQKSFRDKNNLIRHFISHYNNPYFKPRIYRRRSRAHGNRPYKCTLKNCTKSFRTERNLQRHKVSHSG